MKHFLVVENVVWAIWFERFRCFIEFVCARNVQELQRFRMRRIVPDTTIVSDCWGYIQICQQWMDGYISQWTIDTTCWPQNKRPHSKSSLPLWEENYRQYIEITSEGWRFNDIPNCQKRFHPITLTSYCTRLVKNFSGINKCHSHMFIIDLFWCASDGVCLVW